MNYWNFEVIKDPHGSVAAVHVFRKDQGINYNSITFFRDGTLEFKTIQDKFDVMTSDVVAQALAFFKE